MAIVTRNFTKQVLGITSSTYDTQIDLFIPHVEADFLRIRGVAFDLDSNDDIDYPDNAELISAQMIGYLLKTTGFNSGTYSDKMSESIGSYSYSRGGKVESLMGYPLSIVGRIERYQRAHK